MSMVGLHYTVHQIMATLKLSKCSLKIQKKTKIQNVCVEELHYTLHQRMATLKLLKCSKDSLAVETNRNPRKLVETSGNQWPGTLWKPLLQKIQNVFEQKTYRENFKHVEIL